MSSASYFPRDVERLSLLSGVILVESKDAFRRARSGKVSPAEGLSANRIHTCAFLQAHHGCVSLPASLLHCFNGEISGPSETGNRICHSAISGVASNNLISFYISAIIRLWCSKKILFWVHLDEWIWLFWKSRIEKKIHLQLMGGCLFECINAHVWAREVERLLREVFTQRRRKQWCETFQKRLQIPVVNLALRFTSNTILLLKHSQS